MTGRTRSTVPAMIGWVAFVLLVLYVVLIGGGFAGIYLVSLRTASLVAVPAGTKVGYAGHYLYCRPLAPDLLPPGLPRLVFAVRDDELRTGADSGD